MFNTKENGLVNRTIATRELSSYNMYSSENNCQEQQISIKTASRAQNVSFSIMSGA